MGEREADEGIEHGHAEYTTEELLEHAQGNAQGVMIATAAYLQVRGLNVEEWAEAVGTIFGRAWDTEREWDAGEFMDAMLTNFRSVGAEVVSVDLGADRAEAVVTGFPNPELCAALEVQATLAAGFYAVARPIAEALGVTWEWEVDGERTRFVATSAGA